MIIGKNTNLQPKNNFVRNDNNQNTSNNSIKSINPMVETNRVMQHTNVMSKQEMNDKAFAMLQDRLNKGQISMEEFNKMCSQLGKRK